MKEPLFVYISYRKKKELWRWTSPLAVEQVDRIPKREYIMYSIHYLLAGQSIQGDTLCILHFWLKYLRPKRKEDRERALEWCHRSSYCPLVSALAADRCCCARLGTSHQDTSERLIIIMISCILFLPPFKKRYTSSSSALVGARKSPSLGLNPNHPDRLTPKHLRRGYKVFLLFQLFSCLLCVMLHLHPV